MEKVRKHIRKVLFENDIQNNDIKLKWVIEKLCFNQKVSSIDIQGKNLDDDGKLHVKFNMVTDVDNGWGTEAIVKYENIHLKFDIENGELSVYPEKLDGKQTILKINNSEKGGRWTQYAPFLNRDINTTNDDFEKMAMIVEKIIFEMI